MQADNRLPAMGFIGGVQKSFSEQWLLRMLQQCAKKWVRAE
ncbi:hypothetical protein [uncultured Microbulbifer sp.]|nr:hypothetical protein [uncultured Microbulbifer sp.]